MYGSVSYVCIIQVSRVNKTYGSVSVSVFTKRLVSTLSLLLLLWLYYEALFGTSFHVLQYFLLLSIMSIKAGYRRQQF